MNRYCLALDLVDDPVSIDEYEIWHKNQWPEVRKGITDSGIESMEIYRTGNRLCMVIEVDADFSFEKKQEMDIANQKMQEWEQLMWKFQQPLPWAAENEKWVLMNSIFKM